MMRKDEWMHPEIRME